VSVPDACAGGNALLGLLLLAGWVGLGWVGLVGKGKGFGADVAVSKGVQGLSSVVICYLVGCGDSLQDGRLGDEGRILDGLGPWGSSVLEDIWTGLCMR
jgi:hypothetical protein